MLTLIDNYDSFTYNLLHFMGELGAEVVVHRNDKVTVEAVMAANPTGIVLSPGPCDPDRAGICLDLVMAAAAADRRALPRPAGLRASAEWRSRRVPRTRRGDRPSAAGINPH